MCELYHDCEIYNYAGPKVQPQVVTSATAVSAKISRFPAIVTFPLLNDNVALENDEEYTLSLSVNGSTAIVNPATTRIVIQDNDSMWHIF